MADIFITYAREDHEKAGRLAALLERQGWSVWWDRRIPPGRSFDQVIEEALDSSRCVVVLWSSASVSSDWVKAEAAEGKARNVLVPALIEDVRIPLEFRRIQAARLLRWTGPVPEPDMDRFLSSLVWILQGGNGRIKTPKRRFPAIVAGIVIVAAILVALVIRNSQMVRAPARPKPESTGATAGQRALSELVSYKIDVYFDEDNEADRTAATHVRDVLARKAPGTAIVLAPRPLGFSSAIGQPASYEVRYDPEERELAQALATLLNQSDPNWRFTAKRSWSKTEGVLSLVLFSRASSGRSDRRP